MDGFHLYNDDLHSKGIYDHKGAHFTFDVKKFILKLMEIKESSGDILCPIYDRQGIDNRIEDAHPIKANHRMVIVDGNYLLLSI